MAMQIHSYTSTPAVLNDVLAGVQVTKSHLENGTQPSMNAGAAEEEDHCQVNGTSIVAISQRPMYISNLN